MLANVTGLFRRSLAFLCLTCTRVGWCIALGGTTALDTLGSQSYTYSGRNPAAVLPHLVRCLLLLWVLLIPVLMLWFFVAPVLIFLGQKELLSHNVQNFLRVLTLGAPAYVGFESVKRYLQCQGASIIYATLTYISRINFV